MTPFFIYLINGAIGGILYILVSKLGYNDRLDAIRRLLIGIISGYIAYEAKLPEIAAISIAYIGSDAIEALLIKQNLINPPKLYEDRKDKSKSEN